MKGSFKKTGGWWLPTFNRTLEELKGDQTLTPPTHTVAFNRTLEELKDMWLPLEARSRRSFNRTLEELKGICCKSDRSCSTPFNRTLEELSRQAWWVTPDMIGAVIRFSAHYDTCHRDNRTLEEWNICRIVK